MLGLKLHKVLAVVAAGLCCCMGPQCEECTNPDPLLVKTLPSVQTGTELSAIGLQSLFPGMSAFWVAVPRKAERP